VDEGLEGDGGTGIVAILSIRQGGAGDGETVAHKYYLNKTAPIQIR
jgi:hypothetical protein